MKLMKKPLNKQNKTRGFTLLEMLVVVLIIGLLVTIVVINIAHYPAESRVTAAKSQIRELGSALDLYLIDNSAYPTTEQGLDALINEPTGFPAPPAWGPKPYLKGKKIPKDPWGNDYEYTLERDGTYKIMCWGSDGKQGGDEYAADIDSNDL